MQQQSAQQFDAACEKLVGLLKPSVVPTNSNRLAMHINAGGVAVWAAVTCAVVATVVVMFLVVLFAAGFLFFVIHDNWAASEVNTLRAYIYTGKLAPMRPRPSLLPDIEPKAEPQAEAKP